MNGKLENIWPTLKQWTLPRVIQGEKYIACFKVNNIIYSKKNKSYIWQWNICLWSHSLATFLVEFWSFFSINFGYVSDPLCNVNISNVCLFEVEECCTGGRFKLAIKLREHRLDVVLVTLLVALDNFYILYWRFVCEFEQFLVLVWTKTCLTSLFNGLGHWIHPVLIPLLSTLGRFLSPYLYVLFCLPYSIIITPPCTKV